MKEPGSNYIPTLDGWRAIAILGVMIGHSTSAIFGSGGSYPSERWHSLISHGGLGVDIFFGISGLLICTRLLQENRKHGRISLAGFYIRRAFRILPPYLLYLAIVALLGASGILPVGKWEWISCLLFFRNYLAPESLGEWYTAHFWSLAIEEHFYLLWPGVLVLCGIRRARWVGIVIALLVAAWRVVEFRQQWVSHLSPGGLFYWRTDIRLDGLLWGCAAALLLDVPVWKERLTRWLSFPVWLLLLVMFVVCVQFHPPLSMLWQAMLIPLILMATILRPGELVGRALEWRPMLWLGRLSYSLYLWQQLFFVGENAPRPLPVPVLQELPLSILPVFACAVASYYLFETPLIKLGHRLAKRNAVPHAARRDLSRAVEVVEST
ncbi:MAG: acyltransferase [Acidobacteriota bacterium]